MDRKPLPLLLVFVFLFMQASYGLALDNTDAPECLKGTIAKVTESELYMKNTSFPDESLGKRDVMVILDKSTQYYDGTKKISRSRLEPDNLVLVYCNLVGKDRHAKLVRVIGGKKM